MQILYFIKAMDHEAKADIMCWYVYLLRKDGGHVFEAEV